MIYQGLNSKKLRSRADQHLFNEFVKVLSSKKNVVLISFNYLKANFIVGGAATI